MIGLFLASLLLSLMLMGASLLPEERSLEDHGGPQLPAVPSLIWSLRFWILCTLGFGLAGAPLALLGVGPMASLAGALVSGASLGGVLWPVFEEPTMDVTLSDLAGSEGRVLRAVRPDGGRVLIETLSTRLELPARSGDGTEIGVGRKVLVAFVDNGVACVVGYG
jgi:hypothetical protein